MGLAITAFIAGAVVGLLVGLYLLSYLTRRLDRALGHDSPDPEPVQPRPFSLRRVK